MKAFHVHKDKVLLFLTLVAFAGVFAPVWKGLIQAWSGSEQNAHGFFIVPIVLYMLWQKRSVFTEIPLKPSQRGIGWIILPLAVYLLAVFAEVATLASISMVLFLAGAVLLFYGWPMVRRLAVPLGFLLFMIPIPAQIYSALTLELQLMVTEVSVALGSLLGVPIYHEGNVIFLPGRRLQVIEACSGIQSLVSLLVLSALIAFFSLQRSGFKVILFLCGIPLAIAANIVRVVALVIAFYYFNRDLSSGLAHTLLGLIVFMLALGGILLVRRGLLFWETSLTKN
jgi:exosortase A